MLWFFFYVIFSQNVHHNLLLQKMLISFEDFPNFYWDLKHCNSSELLWQVKIPFYEWCIQERECFNIELRNLVYWLSDVYKRMGNPILL